MGGKVSTLKYSSEANPTKRLAHQAKLWLFDELLHLDKAGDGFAAINDAVFVNQREAHHRPDDNLAVRGNPKMIFPAN